MVFKKNNIPWNKGLTKEIDKIMRKISYKNKGNKHWLGRKHSEKTKEKFKKYARANPQHHFKKGNQPWNYIDGRSKKRSPDRYGDDWNQVRKMIYRRDNFKCQHCGLAMGKFKEAFHVHHKIPFLVSFDNSLSNLITLCKSCHSKEESRLRKNHPEWYKKI